MQASECMCACVCACVRWFSILTQYMRCVCVWVLFCETNEWNTRGEKTIFFSSYFRSLFLLLSTFKIIILKTIRNFSILGIEFQMSDHYIYAIYIWCECRISRCYLWIWRRANRRREGKKPFNFWINKITIRPKNYRDQREE